MNRPKSIYTPQFIEIIKESISEGVKNARNGYKELGGFIPHGIITASIQESNSSHKIYVTIKI